jgi:hypothetical protein
MDLPVEPKNGPLVTVLTAPRNWRQNPSVLTMLDPKVAPRAKLIIAVSDLVLPGAAHLVYRLFLRTRDRRRLARRRLHIPLKGAADNPLVTVRIPTYNRGRILVERTLTSVLAQSYQNLEVVIVGDQCTDETASLLAAVNDSRVRFENLETRGNYPKKKRLSWLVAGAKPANRALDLARGEWIAVLDDDDEFTPDHVETMLKAATENELEFLFGRALRETADGRWTAEGGVRPSRWEIVHSTVFYSRRLAFLRYSGTSWIWLEPSDTNMWFRVRSIGAHAGFVDALLTRAYLGRQQLKTNPEIPQAPGFA